MKKLLCCLLFVFVWLNGATLVLHNGKSYTGKIKEKGNVYTIITQDGSFFQFKKHEVKLIDGEKVMLEKNPIVKISTSKGEMQVELFEDQTPNTVANFIQLAESDFFRGMSFHRVINGFMAQGGCPYSKRGAAGQPGTGGPGYTFRNEIRPELKHNARGIISMANSGGDCTNGSQFFICFAPTPWLDGKHTVFGKVIKGMEVLDALEAIGTQSGTPKETVRFSVEVMSKREHEYKVKKN